MNNDTELQRLHAENIGLRLKVKDLESHLKRKSDNFDLLYDSYQGLKLAFDRSRALLQEYAKLPGSYMLGKLDRKLNLFFPEILQSVKHSRKQKISIVEGMLVSRENRDGA